MPKAKLQSPPPWASELSIKYQSAIAHGFLLSGNVQDYVGGVPGQTLKSYLLSSFGERDVVVTWNRAQGFQLPTAEMRRLFVELVDFPLPANPSGLPIVAGRGGLASGLNQAAGATAPDLVSALGKVRSPGDALDFLGRLLRVKTTPQRSARVAVILDYAESIAPATDAAASETDRSVLVTLSEWGRDTSIGERGHIVVLIASDIHDLNERLRKSAVRWEQIQLPFPDLAERSAFVRRVVEVQENEVKLAPGVTYDDIARLTTGLRYIDLEDIVLRASFHHQDLSRDLVKARKDEIMATEFEEVLQVVEHEFGFDALGGLEEVKLDLRETVIEPLRTGQHRVVPQGILFMGPAGTGKTRLARALAKEAGVTFVELQPSKIFSKWVGDTERRLERALTAIAAMTPCLVFIDEIDQAVSRGESGDSGVSNRVFKRLMEVMSDTTMRGKVIWVAASNRPDLLDAALVRPGRLDKKVPILPPDAVERASILEVLTCAAFSKDLPTVAQYQHLAGQMEGYTGAEIEGIVGKAAQLRARSHDQLTVADVLQSAYERIIPTTQNIEAMTRLALLHCNDLDLVPAHLRDLARQLRHPQAREAASIEVEDTDEPQGRRTRKWD
jgi:transitional endoplasmic reticulum ATPase